MRKGQIPHTTSRKGMARLEDEMVCMSVSVLNWLLVLSM